MVSADEARELLEGSTPGPWCAGRSSSGHLCIAQTTDPGEDVAVALDAIFADAALMAAAPDLARTVIALHTKLGEARAAIAEFFAADAAANAAPVHQTDDDRNARHLRFHIACDRLRELIKEDWSAVQVPCVPACRALATLRTAVLDMRALLSTCDEGERWRVHVEEAAWEALEKLARGGQ